MDFTFLSVFPIVYVIYIFFQQILWENIQYFLNWEMTSQSSFLNPDAGLNVILSAVLEAQQTQTPVPEVQLY